MDVADVWPITWEEKAYAYSFSISLPVADTTVLLKGYVTTDVDAVPFIDGSMHVGGATVGQTFHLYLQK